MKNLETAIQQLKIDLLKMMELVRNQVERNQEALSTWDKDVLLDVFANEGRVDVYDLKLGMDCENILAYYSAGNVDLRSLISTCDVGSSLEYLGSSMEETSEFIHVFDKPLNDEIYKKFHLKEMYELTLEVIDQIYNAYTNEDTRLMRKILKNVSLLKAIFIASHTTCVQLVKQFPESVEQILYLYAVVMKTERSSGAIEHIVSKHKRLMKFFAVNRKGETLSITY